jgi:thiol-disulfide isomerase/thioredoxin
MRNNLLLAVILLLISSCTDQPIEHYQLNGHIEGIANKQIVLERISTEGLKTLDTAMIDESGNFKMRGVAEGKSFCRLFLDSKHSWLLVLDNKEIEADLNYATLQTSINGSADSKMFIDLINIQRTAFTNINLMQQELSKARRRGDAGSIMQIQASLNEVTAGNKETIKNYIDTSNTIVKLFAYNLLDFEADIEYLEAGLTAEAKQYGGHYYYEDLKNRLTKIKFLSIGSIAPDLTYKNPNGELMSLSDLKGKVVLLDFWASWCAPCRKDNPNVVRIYNEYKDKGFEVFSVSLDKDGKQWVQAIQADGLAWPAHISDLNGWKSAPAKTYGIKSIPSTFLLGKDGKIIAKNLRGRDLEEKIKSLF